MTMHILPATRRSSVTSLGPESMTRPFHLLVVEDDNNHAEIILRMLRRNKLVTSVDRVSDGEQALAYLQQAGRGDGPPLPNIILLDLKLPKIDGHEVLAHIKQDLQLRPIPTVVLSTSSSERDRMEAYRRGANSYLVKPVSFILFRQLLDDLTAYWSIWNLPAPASQE
jgi:CheY-like chemotaxis protein